MLRTLARGLCGARVALNANGHTRAADSKSSAAATSDLPDPLGVFRMTYYSLNNSWMAFARLPQFVIAFSLVARELLSADVIPALRKWSLLETRSAH